MQLKQIILALTLIILSFLSRLLFLDTAPHGFYRDEASVGYNAYSLIKTGRDEFGKTFPLVFEALGDYKLPVIIYATAPFTFLFGNSDFWVRFPTAVIGALTPLALYFLASKIFNKKIAYLSSLSLAASPWHILFSRSVNESVFSVFTFILGFYYLILLFEKWRFKNLIFAALLLFISFTSYRTQFVFIPLVIAATVILYHYKKQLNWTKYQKKLTLVALGIFLFFSFYTVKSAGFGRIKNIGLAQSAQLRLILEEQIREDGRQLPAVTRLFHNKLNNFLVTSGTNYVSHFDPSYLFFIGDEKSSNNSTPFMGHLLFMDLPFVLLGLIFLIRQKITSAKILIFLWLIFGPLASSLTVDSPSSLRNLISSVAWSMVIGYGIVQFFMLFDKKRKLQISLITFILLLYSANFIFFLHQFFVHKKVHRPWFRDVGLKETVSQTLLLQGDYDNIVFAPYPDLYIFFLHYAGIDPAFIQNRQKNIQFKDRKNEIMHLINPKYSFMEKDCILDGDKNTLYVCIKDRIPKNARVIKSVRLADDQPAFTFIDFNGKAEDLNQKFPPGYSQYTENTN